MKYRYPAIFTRESDGKYDVVFPDLEGCYTCGDNLADAIHMAEDVLAFTLSDYEKAGKAIPRPSIHKKTRNIRSRSMNKFVRMIICDTGIYNPTKAAAYVRDRV